MCGIVGAVLSGSNQMDSSRISRLVPLLKHRGPDNSAVRTLGRACFGHTRLSIIGLEEQAADQPCVNDRYLFTFNGEIYNYELLSRALQDDGCKVSGNSDTEVFFRMLQLWPIEKVLDMVDGMFAFGLYDQNTNKLYLARDPLGEKPLYWAQSKGDIYFASQTLALLNVPEIADTPNIARIGEFFTSGTISGEQTFFEDIFEVEPGTVLSIDLSSRSAVSKSRYWDLMDIDLFGPDNCHDYLASDEIDAKIADAVSSRLVSDVPVGLMLSGGIDSATVAEFVLSRDPTSELHVFFADNIDRTASERSQMQSSLRQLRARYPQSHLTVHQHQFNPEQYVDEALRLCPHYDQPIMFPITPQLSALAGLARDAEFKVLLSGEGADELFYGYDRFTRTQRSFHRFKDDGLTCKKLLFFGGGSQSIDRVAAITGQASDFHQETAAWSWLEDHYGDTSFAKLQMLFSQRFRLQTLLQRQDRIGMLHGVEIRVPFLQPSLVRWINSLPDHIRMPNPATEQKTLLKNLMRGKLSPAVLSEKKRGSPSDIVAWLYTRQGLKKMHDLTSDSNSFTVNFLNKAYVEKMLVSVSANDSSFGTLLWYLFSLELWFLSLKGRPL